MRWKIYYNEKQIIEKKVNWELLAELGGEEGGYQLLIKIN